MQTDVNAPVVPLEYTIGQLHSLTVLLPILIFTAVLICDLIHTFGKPKALVIGHWLVILGLLACMPAILTGLEAAQHYRPESELLENHRWLGFATGISCSLYAGLRISTMLWKLPISKKWYLVMSVLLLALVTWTSDVGILLSSR
ncbi:MAG: hypothetical protein H0X29_10685 [Parachlamydiaceae bacterium]|nr:hypothetical protein [Parachlamydiaceae bacterium]